MMRKLLKAAFETLPTTTQEGIRSRLQGERPSRRYLRFMTTDEGYTLTSADRLKCIFIHIPKCAGISLSRSLFGTLGGGHLRASDYKRIYSPEEWTSYFKFTFVRNPWDRLVSAFRFLKAGGMNREDADFACRHLKRFDTFEDFVQKWVSLENIMRYVHFRPQTHFIAIESKAADLDFVGYYENLQDDFAFVRDRLGVKVGLSAFNRTPGEVRDYKNEYTASMIKIVADVYAKDVAFLGYTFDNSNVKAMIAKRDERLTWRREWLYVGASI